MSEAARPQALIKCVYHPGLGRINLTVPPGKVRSWWKTFTESKGQSLTTLQFDYPFVNYTFREVWKVQQKGFAKFLDKWRKKYVYLELSNNDLLNCAKFALCFGEANRASMEMAIYQWEKDGVGHLEEVVSLMRKTLFDERIGYYPFNQLKNHLIATYGAQRQFIHLLQDISTPYGFQLVLNNQKKTRNLLNRNTELASDIFQGAMGIVNAAGTVPKAEIQKFNRGIRLVQGKERGIYGSKPLDPGSVTV